MTKMANFKYLTYINNLNNVFFTTTFKKPIVCWKAPPLNESQDILSLLSPASVSFKGYFSSQASVS